MSTSKSLPESNPLATEMANLHEILAHVYSTPTSFSLANIDVAGQSFPLQESVGGDHIIFVDFKHRYDLDHRVALAEERGDLAVAANLSLCRDRLGVLLADVSGHQATDALLAAMLHQAFLVGVLYELEIHGEVTTGLFEILNTRFYQSSSVRKFVTMVYGEINEDGTFRFISAGHPAPLIFSREADRFVHVDPRRMVSLLPLGLFPSAADVARAMAPAPRPAVESFTVNEVTLMSPGDILLLATDGVIDLEHDGKQFVRGPLERVLRHTKDEPASDILAACREALVRFAPADDDASLVVLKRLR